MAKYILAVDHGTSGVKTSLVSSVGDILDTVSQPLTTHFSEDGGAEQSPDDWWQALKTGCRTLATLHPDEMAEISAVGISSTFSTTVAVDIDSNPVYPALMWMDSRGAPDIQNIIGGWPSFDGYRLDKAFQWVKKTGGAPTLSGKDDLAHMLWLKRQHPDLYEKTHCFLPSKDYFNARLTGVQCASYDSIALFWLTNNRDSHHIDYDPLLLQWAGVDRKKLPTLRPAASIMGTIRKEAAEDLSIPVGTPVATSSADHHCALLGSGAVELFQGHLYVGTSSWIQCHVPFKKTDPFHSIASLPASLPDFYYCANEQDYAGGCFDFIVDKLNPQTEGQIFTFDHASLLAADAQPGCHNILFCPWLNGERSPVDDTVVRGGFLNITKSTTQGELIRAVMEGVALNARWNMQYVEKFIGRPFPNLRIIGGGALSDTWCQIYADILGREIHRVAEPRQANARGAAYLAALALDLYPWQQIATMTPVERVFIPDPSQDQMYSQLFLKFKKVFKKYRAICHLLQQP